MPRKTAEPPPAPRPQDIPGTRTVTQWRVEAREKGSAWWQFIPFTGAGPWSDEQRAWDMAELATVRSPMYEYRVTHRTVTTTTTAWEE
jgi:hypothetical protein